MSLVRVDTDWSYGGLPVVVLENAALRLVVVPVLGGKILSLVDKATDVELLWRHPRLVPRPVPFGASYDDQFVGGWDELYPNDEPEELAGEPMPDHGELWTLPWHAATASEGDTASVTLSTRTPISSSAVTKTLTLHAAEPHVRVDYRLHNTGTTPQPFLWKSHVAVAIETGARVDMGAETVLLHSFGRPRARGTEPTFVWPTLEAEGLRHDMRETPAPDSGLAEFLIATAMREGFCEVSRPAAGVGLRLDFDLAALPSCWLFGSYGGWRGLHTLVLEPCTGYPLSVRDGVAAGTHQVLTAASERRWTVMATVTHPA